MNLLDKITLEDLSEDQREVAELIGLDVYIKLIKTCSGTVIYIPKADTVIKRVRDESIINEFNGYNIKYLTKKYNLTEPTIRAITSKKLNEIKEAPLDGQMDFYGNSYSSNKHNK